MITLHAWRENREAATAVAKRRPWLLRPLLRQAFPPLRRDDPAERIGVRPETVRTPGEGQRVLTQVWEALRHGEIGPREATRIARRVRAVLRLQRRCSRIVRRAAAE